MAIYIFPSKKKVIVSWVVRKYNTKKKKTKSCKIKSTKPSKS